MIAAWKFHWSNSVRVKNINKSSPSSRSGEKRKGEEYRSREKGRISLCAIEDQRLLSSCLHSRAQPRLDRSAKRIFGDKMSRKKNRTAVWPSGTQRRNWYLNLRKHLAFNKKLISTSTPDNMGTVTLCKILVFRLKNIFRHSLLFVDLARIFRLHKATRNDTRCDDNSTFANFTKIFSLLYFSEEPTTAGRWCYRCSSGSAISDDSRFAFGGEHARQLARNVSNTLHSVGIGIRFSRRMPGDLHVRHLKARRKDVGRSHSIRRCWTAVLVLCK